MPASFALSASFRHRSAPLKDLDVTFAMSIAIGTFDSYVKAGQQVLKKRLGQTNSKHHKKQWKIQKVVREDFPLMRYIRRFCFAHLPATEVHCRRRRLHKPQTVSLTVLRALAVHPSHVTKCLGLTWASHTLHHTFGDTLVLHGVCGLQTMCPQYISLAKMGCHFGSRIRTLILQDQRFSKSFKGFCGCNPLTFFDLCRNGGFALRF